MPPMLVLLRIVIVPATATAIAVLRAEGADDWRYGWWVVGAVAAIGAVAFVAALRRL